MVDRIRLKQITPAPWAIASFLIIFVFFEGLTWYLESRNIPIAAELPFRPGRLVLLLASVLYGLRRVVAFHPLWRGQYADWLGSTPWTIRKPLPMGPVELVWEDGLILGSLILLSAILPEPHAIQLLCAFLFSHLLALTATLWMTALLFTRIRAIGYVTAFGLGLGVWLWHQPLACLAALTVVYLIAYEGLRRGLEQFPWIGREMPNLNHEYTKAAGLSESCGWPYDRLMHDTSVDPDIPRIDAVLCCMLGSWWLFVIASVMRQPRNDIPILFIPYIVGLVVSPMARLGVYMSGYRSPISLWGQIWTFRWIIPAYDQVFVAPFCSLLAGPTTLFLLSETRVLPLEVCLVTATGVTALVAVVAPPRLRRWRLTGQHRIVHAISRQKEQLFVKVG